MRATRPISELVPNEAVEAVVRRQSLEARFQHRGAQLRNFHRHAHLFASRGLDAQATYQKLQELHELDRPSGGASAAQSRPCLRRGRARTCP